MTRVFADTSFYVALTSPRDALDQCARELASRHTGQVVTTEYVLIETANFFARVSDRQVFPKLLEALRTDLNTIIAAGTRDRFLAGCVLYENRPDKDWSLTDCISFLVMQEDGLTEAFTADHHFEQAGFRTLMQ